VVAEIDIISYSFNTAPYPMKVFVPPKRIAVLVEGADAAIPELDGTKEKEAVPPP
jgi:hypothetical protein